MSRNTTVPAQFSNRFRNLTFDFAMEPGSKFFCGLDRYPVLRHSNIKPLGIRVFPELDPVFRRDDQGRCRVETVKNGTRGQVSMIGKGLERLNLDSQSL